MDFNLYTVSKKNFFSRTYYIYGDDEYLYYSARRSFFLSEFVLCDEEGEILYRVKRNFALFKWSFSIYRGSEIYAKINSKSGLKTRLNIHTPTGDYHIEGQLLNREFTIYRDTDQIAKVSRPQSLQLRMGIAIKSKEDDAFVLALVLLIELIVKLKQSRK